MSATMTVSEAELDQVCDAILTQMRQDWTRIPTLSSALWASPEVQDFYRETSRAMHEARLQRVLTRAREVVAAHPTTPTRILVDPMGLRIGGYLERYVQEIEAAFPGIPVVMCQAVAGVSPFRVV